MKKCYVADLSKNGAIVGSAVQVVWFWQSAFKAHCKMIEAVSAYEPDLGIVNFKRVR